MIVVGGGVIGLAIAWRAARAGLTVTLLERDRVGGGTTRHAAGMLAPVSEADPTEPGLLELGITSARAYPAFIDELRAATPLDPGYRSCGTLLVARDGDEAAVLERSIALRGSLRLDAHRLLPSRARGLEPALAPSLRLAAELPDDHAIDPRALCASLADALTRAGGTLRESADVAELVNGGVRLCDGEQLSAEHVVIAAGVWSERLGPGGPPLRPVKGQILRLRDPRGPGLVGRVLRAEGVYLVPRGDGRYVAGATMEERGFDQTVTAGGAFALLRELTELVPGASELVLEELSAGLRPAAPDNEPAIGAGGLPGLVWAVGHYRGGVLLAPVTAELVCDLLCAGTAPPARFSPERFSAGVRA
ncbi:MAG TPA: glycine oxidase ThiO [Solirubrobacteraceae bacterium]|nr:glycine oxidase ThiO [Solirubrobacteraceae bacterium]